jgi:hypothetical protein
VRLRQIAAAGKYPGTSPHRVAEIGAPSKYSEQLPEARWYQVNTDSAGGHVGEVGHKPRKGAKRHGSSARNALVRARFYVASHPLASGPCQTLLTQAQSGVVAAVCWKFGPCSRAKVAPESVDDK